MYNIGQSIELTTLSSYVITYIAIGATTVVVIKNQNEKTASVSRGRNILYYNVVLSSRVFYDFETKQQSNLVIFNITDEQFVCKTIIY